MVGRLGAVMARPGRLDSSGGLALVSSVIGRKLWSEDHMKVDTVDGDLLDQDVDAIVNAWNRNVIPWWLLVPQGVSGAIKRRGGTAPFREVARYGPIPLGGAVVTSAGRLPHKAVIHVAGINLLWTATERSVRDATRNAVLAAVDHGFRSMAFPVIGAGSGRFREEGALALMRFELADLDHDLRVVIVRFRQGRKNPSPAG